MIDRDTVIPTVHLNGTSAEQLMESYLEVRRALVAARDALCKAAPHGRDYYPQGQEASTLAFDQHYLRVKRLEIVTRELETILLGIQAQKRD